MELRRYWRVLVRRRKVIRNTFLLVLVLALITVGFGYYSSAYKARATFDMQVQPEPQRVSGAVVDPYTAANANTDQVVLALLAYGTTVDYFKTVQNALKKQGVDADWKALGASLSIQTGKSHDITVEWSSSDQNVALKIVTAAAAQLESFVKTYKNDLLPSSPQIRVLTTDRPTVQRVSFTKPLTSFVLELALGLVAGIILAYLFEYLDNTIQDEADVERWMGVPTLAVIPGGRGGRASRARSA